MKALTALTVVVVLGAYGPAGGVSDTTVLTPTSSSTTFTVDEEPDVTVTTVVSDAPQDEVVSEEQVEELENLLDEVEAMLDDTENLMDEPLP
ncbi:MAG TPA: hypothetical protein VIH55_03205 [Acidimicrobiia bacterium]